MVKCHNCRGKGSVTGARKMIRDEGYIPKRKGICIYCKGNGYRKWRYDNGRT